ncbi:helix-turn-helix domain-containing protein [Ramlibacter sp. PS4R-6]|uniref:helix-turn-helix domain-containing protein n=1 Tax=Ramlibacter sp. PS4R-6 TaxID=3133438 RepID=UPI0030A4EC8D
MSEAAVAEAPAQAEASAGTLLRRAREASGLHVAALAVALKVPVRKLEALEDDRFEELGDAVFIRALASSVCRTLKVDAQPVLARLPQTAAPRLVRDNDGLNAPFRAPGDGPAPSWLDAVRQPVPLAVLALLVGAVVVYFMPVSHTEEKAAAVAPAPVPAAAPVAFVPAPTVRETPAPAAAAPAAVAPAPEAASPAVVSATTPPAAASGIVVLRTRGESWVEVVDAKGAVALRKIMAAGESAGATGALPLTVTVGKADVTEVEVRGRKFDLKPVSKDNVARFDVK